jgi:uncharacterized protein (DUF1501 family)
MNSISRRRFISNTLVTGCSLAANPWITPVSLAAAPTNNRLVVIILRGAMDGLDVVRPVGDRQFAEYRPSLNRDGEIALDGFYALHPALQGLSLLWKSGELAFAHAVSTPYRDKRSHFDGQNLLEAGTFTGNELIDATNSGWLNRVLTLLPGAEAQTAFAVGVERLLILQGDAPYSKWAPGRIMPLTPQAKYLFEKIYANDQLFHSAAEIAGLMTDELLSRGMGEAPDAMMPEKNMLGERMIDQARSLANFAADRMNAETRIAAFSLGGWDTHTVQNKSLPVALAPLQTAILTLKEKLDSNWSTTTVLCLTEFGRSARENGARGTDHGTGSAMILAGGAVRGGKVFGKWPGLESSNLYQDRDLMPTSDVRVYAATALEQLFGLKNSTVRNVVFPNLTDDTTVPFLL